VNGRRLNIASYQVKVDDVVTLSPKALEIPYVKKVIEQEDVKIPAWLERKAAVGRVVRIPIRDDVVEPISENDIVEFYSR
jgi:small subunit ribosomal protein S4